MTEASLRAIISGLNAKGIRYLVVGGLAVNAHGYVRNTNDLDLLLSFDSQNLLAALQVLKELGYEPKVPVQIEEFADPVKRETWIKEKNMTVFGLRSAFHQETDVDLFVQDPLGFDEAFTRAYHQPLLSEIAPIFDPTYTGDEADPDDTESVVNVPFCSYDDLIKLKNLAGRYRDLDDIDRLRIIRGE